jgi:transcriptional regulator with XRE-family HTH domain
VSLHATELVCSQIRNPTKETTMPAIERSAFGATLRNWRNRRRISQLDLALEAGISARHLAFLETGRAKPSRTMVAQLSEALDVPVQSRNDLLLTAGFAPQFTASKIDDEALAPLRKGLNRLLDRHTPYPGLLLDRYWNVVQSNRTAKMLLDLLPLDDPEPNLLTRLSTSPRTPEVIENWPSVATEFLARLKAEALRSGDLEFNKQLERFRQLVPGPLSGIQAASSNAENDPLLYVRIRLPNGVKLSLFSAVGQFSAARDITAADLRIELFFPADSATEQILQII